MYTAQKFTFSALEGISEKQLDVHIKLYEGYVKFLNTLEATQADLMKDSEKNAYALGEVTRRIGFEWNGMRMHEHYFSQWEGAPTPIGGKLADALSAQYGSYDTWLAQFKGVSMMRGIGWGILSYDQKTKRFTNHFVADHELGQLNGLTTVLALDMWEHAFMVDYVPAEKAKYVEAFLKNLNGAVPEERFASAIQQVYSFLMVERGKDPRDIRPAEADDGRRYVEGVYRDSEHAADVRKLADKLRSRGFEVEVSSEDKVE